MTTNEMQIPFSGFYCSRWSDAIERAEEHEAEHETEEFGTDETAYANLCFDKTDYSLCRREIAKAYAKEVITKIDEILGEPSECIFSAIVSPREYNFQTDRIFITVTDETFRLIERKTNLVTLQKLIAEQCTSRSGFISFYPNTLEEWFEKPVSQWDHNQRGIVLEAFLRSNDILPDELEDEIEEYFSSNGVIDNAIWAGRDVAEFEAALEELRKQAV